MLAVAELTIRRLKEPSFLLMLFLAVFIGYCVSEIEPLSEQGGVNSLLAQLSSVDKGTPMLTSTLCAFAITTLVAIFAGAAEIPRDIESGMIMLIISKPVRKIEYLIGKYIGMLVLCLLFFFATELSVVVVHFFKSGELYPLSVMLRQSFVVLAIFPVLGVTIAISCFFNDITSMILTAAYFLFAVAISVITLLMALLPETLRESISFTYIIYYFFPNFIYYFQTYKLFGIVSVSMVIYSLSVTFIFMAIATNRLLKRDLI